MNMAPIVIERLNYAFGEGPLRRQVLFDVTAEIDRGEIVILTGPSGSGKTTLLTLIGALRSVQEGTLRVLDQELAGASEAALAAVRKRVGYIFQAHNLLEALTAQQNVQVTLQLHPELNGKEITSRAADALGEVGLGDRLDSHPSHLSGGERQRVAIARALAGRPELLLADEPTASLDRKTGRELVELLQRLTKTAGVTVVLVTHDSRILDVADRILTLEDGRLSSLMSSVTAETQHMMHLLAGDLRKGHLAESLSRMEQSEFEDFLEQVTNETRHMLEIADLVQEEAFFSVEQQVIEAVGQKLAGMFKARGAGLYFVDPDTETLRFTLTDIEGPHGQQRSGSIDGFLGEILRTGKSLNAADVRKAKGYDPEIDGADRQCVLAVPVMDSQNRVFAVVELRDKQDGEGFTDEDERDLTKVARSLGVLVESWWRMGCGCRRGAVGRDKECRPPDYCCH